MTPAQFNAFCSTLPHTTHVVQWGGADVWKVGARLFAAMWADGGKNAGITFKVSALGYEILSQQPGLRPAPYMASRGMTWVQWYSDASMGAKELKLYLRQSYDLVLAGMPRKQRVALGATACFGPERAR